MNLTEFRAAAPAFYQSRTALELVSGPGVGKSSIMYAVAALMSKQLGKPFGIVTQILSGMDPTDVRGFLFPIKTEGALESRFSAPSIFPKSWNVEVYVNGELDREYNGPVPDHGILFIDEFGQAEQDVQKPMGQVLLDRRIGEHTLPDGWVVWAASNRMEDRSGVVKSLAFLQNRRKVLTIEAQYQPWEDWAVRNGIHPLVIGFAKRHPAEVFRESVPKDPGPFCTPRSLVLCHNDLMAMRTAEHGSARLPDDHIAGEVVAGWLGAGASSLFMQYTRLANDLPELEDIIKKPNDTEVPTKIDARFVLAMMLAHHSEKSSISPILTYMERLDEDLQVLFVTSVSRRDPMLLTDVAFSKWLKKHSGITFSALT